MDILKRTIAPITLEAWDEIDALAVNVLKGSLSARKVVDVEGPNGWDYAALPLGRLQIIKKTGPVQAGVHQVQPLVELRAPFTLDIWEVDNIVRGAKDIDLGALETAARAVAEYEEKAIYYGDPKAGIKGLKQLSSHKPVPLCVEPQDILSKVSQAVSTLMAASIEGPYAMVVSPELWMKLASHIEGHPLRTHVEDLLQGQVHTSPYVDDAFVVSTRGGDMRLVLGQDLAIGYNSNDTKTVNLFFTESFTFQVAEPAACVVLSCK